MNYVIFKNAEISKKQKQKKKKKKKKNHFSQRTKLCEGKEIIF
jgi:hypothetical protein